MTQEPRKAFDQDGLVRLPGAIPRADAMGMADRIRQFLTDRTRAEMAAAEDHLREHPGGFQPLKLAVRSSWIFPSPVWITT